MERSVWTIRDLLGVTTDYLKNKRVESPRLTSEVLLAHQLGVDRVALYLNFDQPLTDEELSGYRTLIRRRVAREPIQYLTGVQEFWSLEFKVGPNVLIPRADSELLVERALALAASSIPPARGPLAVLDMGTGSGALAVAIATELPEALICAVDVSEEALGYARLNALAHGMNERIRFVRGDLWEPLTGGDHAFDLIVSNPPYVAREEFGSLPPEVRDHEPARALDGGPGGMREIQRLVKGALPFLKTGGWILIEMDPRQTGTTMDLMAHVGGYAEVSRVKDLAKRYRVVEARKA